ncbi:SRPBCC domain-containing protein [Arthrobacter sp. 35W]|uniref:SRPBCC domain-containing protein n=1 Tax=Arthrobacter sp. 35W TaxID=1132441 RepID=UPI0003F92939|nr:SRPBCC domain-containing protein [Arthrobacter sp. 35W]
MSTELNTDMTRHPLGTAAHTEDGTAVLALVREYPAPPAVIWAMLTDPAKTELWWARTRGMARTGSSFDLKWLNGKDMGEGTELDWWNGKVLAAEDGRLLEISNAMHGVIRAELSELPGGGTRLVFTNTINATDDVVLMSLAGWHCHLDHLQEALDGKAVDWPRWWDDFYPAWEKIHAAYQQAQA